jgi:glycosyltransferase involved in cell wall biosynthesis
MTNKSSVRPIPSPKSLTPSPLYINGRFLTQRQTGVQRFAMETLTALDAQWGVDAQLAHAPTPIVLTPRGALLPELEHISFRTVGRLQGHAWEQFELPLASAGGFLLNFGATGPVIKRKQLVTVHDAAVHVVPEAYSFAFRLWYKTLIPLLGQSSAGVMTVSQFSKDQLRTHFGIPENKLWVCTEGHEHMNRTPVHGGVLEAHGLVAGGYFLAVSSMSPHKNFGLITEALAHLVGSGITVAIAGSTDSSVFHTLAPDETKLVKLLGYVSDSELKTLLANAVALIHPSRYEGFGLSPLEAMAVGCPVLASNAAAIPEVCGDAVWYFDPHNAAELARLVSRLTADRAARDNLRAAGLRRAKGFRWRDTGAAYVRTLAQLGVLDYVSRPGEVSEVSETRATDLVETVS